jgi:hypothetical protein
LDQGGSLKCRKIEQRNAADGEQDSPPQPGKALLLHALERPVIDVVVRQHAHVIPLPQLLESL